MAAQGIFITYEGGEGSGKSRQSRALARRLRRRGSAVVLTHEPGGEPLAARLRRLLKGNTALTPEAELLLFAASRAQLTARVIRPALEVGQMVVCDRYADSTLAYQGYGRGLSMEAIRAANRMATGGLTPHLTVLLDVPAEVGLARKHADDDRFIREPLPFHQRVRQGYLELARSDPKRWLVVDATLPEKEVADTIWRRVALLLRRRGKP
ncbi:MAG: dTMP kinase [Dehalococcoidia bacterium]